MITLLNQKAESALASAQPEANGATGPQAPRTDLMAICARAQAASLQAGAALALAHSPADQRKLVECLTEMWSRL
jgi:hypothetical protein